MIVRILIWSLFDSRTTIDELQGTLPGLEPPNAWIWSETSERLAPCSTERSSPIGSRGPVS